MPYVTDPVTGDQEYIPDEPSLNPEDQPGGYYLPPGAEVSERDAQGNPISYTFRGETYWAPGSQAYKQGFRTESERIQDGGERQVGLAMGESVPEDTIIVTDASGKPLRRYTQYEVGLDPSHYGEQARLGNVRYPVKDFVGREKLLKEADYTKLADAKTDTERLAVSKKLGLVPENWTLDDFTGAKAERESKKEAAEAFVSQQEAARFERTHVKMGDGQYISKDDWKRLQQDDPEGAKVLGNQGFKAYDKYVADYNKKVAENNAAVAKQERALKLTAPYTEGDKVNVIGFLRQYGASGEKALKDLGYEEKDIQAWRQMSKDPRYLYADFNDKVVQKRADILKNISKAEAKLAGENLYTYADGKARAEVLKGYSPADQKSIQGSTFAAVENIVIPYVETGANWKYMTPQERAVAVTFETATILATIYGPRIIGKAVSPAFKPFTAGGQAQRLAVKAGKAAESVAAARTELAKFTTTADLKLNQVAMAMRAQEVKVAEAASRKADLAFIQKFEKLNAVSPKELAKFEKAAKLPGFKKAVLDVRKSASRLDDAWKAAEAKQSRLYTNPKTKAQLESNVRHQFRLAEVEAAQGRLQDSLARAGSYLEPRYKTAQYQIPEWQGRIQHSLESRIKDLRARKESLLSSQKDELEALERLSSTKPLRITGEYRAEFSLASERDLSKTTIGQRRRLFEQLKVMRDSKLISLDEYENYLARLKNPPTIEPPQQGKMNLGKIQPLSPETEAKVRTELTKGQKESREAYERAQKEGMTALKEREAEVIKLAEKARQPLPEKIQPKPQLKASEIPALKPEGKPSPFSLRPKPSVKTETAQRVEVKPDIRQIPREGIKTDVSARPDVQSRRIEEVLTRSNAFEKTTPAEWQQVREAIQSGVVAHQQSVTQGATQTQAQTAVKQAVREALQSKTSQQTRTRTQQQVRLITRQVVKTDLRLKVRPRIPLRLPGGSDKEARAAIIAANGAIGWRQGEVGGKARYDVIINPYQKDEDYVMVLGAPPRGAAIATGAKSAYRTAKVLYGKGPKKDFSVDSGFQDVKVDAEGKKVTLTFTPDPKGLTRGDIQIGRRTDRISGRLPRISQRRPRIGR